MRTRNLATAHSSKILEDSDESLESLAARKNLHKKKPEDPSGFLQVFLVQKHAGLAVGVLSGSEKAVGLVNVFFNAALSTLFVVCGFPIGGH